MTQRPLPHIEIRLATAHDRRPIARMLELYQHDLSDIWPSDLDAHGEYGYELDRYWSDAHCHPFVALCNQQFAGFALVDNAVKVGRDGHWMDQFFVLKKYRRSGVGSTLAGAVFAALPGAWEVGQMPANLPAQAFWRRVIGTHAEFVEHRLNGAGWQGVVQCFRCGARGGQDGAGARPAIRIRDIDHLVLRVADLERMLRFYCEALGCAVERRLDDIGLVQLRAGRSIIDLVPVASPLGRAGGAAPGMEGRNLDHFCLRVDPFDEAVIRDHLRAHGIEAGPIAARYGAEGEGPSLYLDDPEGNVVELKGPPSG